LGECKVLTEVRPSYIQGYERAKTVRDEFVADSNHTNNACDVLLPKAQALRCTTKQKRSYKSFTNNALDALATTRTLTTARFLHSP